MNDITAWLTAWVTETTGVTDVRPDRPLHEYGLSSRDMVRLVAELGDRVGAPLAPTLAYQHPTISALAAAVTAESGAAPVERVSAAPTEPIAVVGIGCRLPGGVEGPADFWRLLDDAADAIGARPDGRWTAPEHVLAGLPVHGGWLDDVAGFDAGFFGITPREAAVMDPQQRITLEVAWAALEHAGIAPSTLRGSRTGVYMGVSSTEYGTFTLADPAAAEAWASSGAAASVVANRLSYLLDLRGPSQVIDTACSSSLVAVHTAIAALRSGEADLALAGGVNVLLTPGITAGFQRAGALAADGRCKAFDAAADGIARAEGCGVVVLRRLSDARAAGDRVLAVLRGSAVNSDGRSNGLLAPNPAAQAALLADVYPEAGVDPGTVDYVEAHGTGTLLGDPIEAGALGAVLGAGRDRDRPLLLGSVKSNLGHLEAASGIAGLIKVVLAMAHGRLPASLHFTRPNPHIDFDGLGLRVVDEGRDWPRYSGLACAGVSAFGFGGTNAHVIVEEWPALPAAPTVDSGLPEILAVSGPDAAAVRERAAVLADWLETEDAPVADVAAVLAARRDHLPARAAVVAADRAEAVAGLRAVADVRTAAVDLAGPVFVFSGFGSSWPGMGAKLLAGEPAFAEAVADLDPLFQADAGFSLLDVLSADGDADALPDLTVAAPALFGMQLALARLWQAHDVHPAAVLGHSVGEVAAAVIAGALDPAQGLRVVTARSALLARLDGGAMAAVELSDAEFADLAPRFPGVGIAVHAAPGQCTVSGDRDGVAALVAHVEGMGRLARPLKVVGAGHSPDVDPFLGELRAALDGLAAAPAVVPCFSSVHDDPPAFDIDYWAANLRSPVRFRQAVEAAAAAGHRTFLEISPHPIAAAAVEQTIGEGAVIATLRRGGDWPRAVADLHVAGDSAALLARYPDAPVLDLPGPVWRHERHWTAPPSAGPAGHPLLGAHVEVPDDGRHIWQADLGANPPPWQPDHHAFGVGVLPGTAFLEAAIAAGRRATGADRVVVTDLALAEFLAPNPDTVLSTSLTRDGRVTVSAKGSDAAWVTHATGHVGVDTDEDVRAPAAPAALAPIDLYAAFAAIGQDYGPAFQGLSEVRAAPGYAAARVALPDAAGGHGAYAAHPALVDACLQAIGAAALGLPGVRGRHVPTGFGRVRLLGDVRMGTRCVAEAALGDSGLLGAVYLLDDAGTVLLAATGVRVTSVADPDGARTLECRWEPAPLPVGSDTPRTVASTVDDEDASDVVLTLSGDGRDVTARAARAAARLAERARPPRLWLVTEGGNGPEPGDPDLVCLRGLVRVLAFEHPELRATLLDVDAASGPAAVAAEVRAGRPDDEVAWRDGTRLRARLAPVTVPDQPPPVGPGAYLITGGLGELGGHIAAWLAERGATRIVLAGRTARQAPDVPGVEVVVGDIAEPGVAERFVAHARRDGVPLRGVVHGAAVLADEPVAAMTDDALARVWRPKAEGALRLHDAVDDPDVWWLALTSVAGLIGSPGQGAYAAANAWVDALAARRRAAGLPALSIAFGAWRGAAADARANAALADLDPADGLAAIGALLADGRTGVGVSRLDGARTLALFPELARRPFLAAVAGARPEPEPTGWAGPDALRALPDPRGAVLDRLVTGLAALIGADPARVDTTTPLTRMGLDSLMAMRLRAAVQRDFDRVLPVPLLLRGASLRDVADHLGDELGLPAARTPRADIGPRDTAERWVARVWTDALGAPVTDVHTAFATLGGDAAALAAVRAALAERLGADFAVSELDTVAGVADRLRDDLERPTSGLVHTLRAEGRRRPLFLFHPAGGPTTVYQPLVAELPPGYPVHGFERIDDVSTVEEKAERYAALLRGIQPRGPYRLGGWSFGGVLAYETAHVLTAMGETVEQVVLIDSILPERGGAAEDAALLAGRFARFAEHVERTYGVPLDLPADLADRDEDAQIGWVMARLGAIPGIGDAVLRHQYTSYVDARVAERYRPRPYGGPVVLLRATDPHPLTTTLDPRYLRTDDTLGWDEFCADLTVRRVPGDHLSMIDPPAVGVLARLLDAAVEAVEV
ncbi:type I polyketide synthase [Actinokineospora fastidiosa]|uniref:Polyketide synthase n=1 Tax=Actinokineospora fastidiosa TaxID=1816 RepID=A0A918GTP1_9PSEU|nr:type I polyketide synthase [Actinokineospora fastidiosa]GGS60927.1 polyketide synthase [Actinokineospora fastidiosa]